MAENEVGLRISLKDRRAASAELAQLEKGVHRVGDAAETAGRKAEDAGRRWDRFRSVVGTMARGAAYGIGALTALGAAAAGVGIRTVASMEQAKIAFTTMLGSATRARTFLGQLSEFAAKTPFEFPELQTAASSLVSVGIRADKVIPIMTTLGDVTSGMGTGAEGIRRATVALQQMNAAQRITGEDLNQLRDAGIPVYDLLAAALGKTKGEVVALAQSGKLGKDALDAMMRSLETGRGLERFNGLMEQQSQSLTGLWSTMTDTVTMGLKRIFTPVRPLAKDALRWLGGLAESAIPRLRSGVKSTVEVVRSMVKAFQDGGFRGVLEMLGGGASDGAGRFATAFAAIGASVAGVNWSAFGDALGQGASDTLSVFAVAVGFAADHIDLLAKAMPYLVVGLVLYKGAQGAANAMAVASLPLKAAEIVATMSHSRALKAHAAAMAASTTATAAGTLATGAGVVATNAETAATNRGILAKVRMGAVTAAATVKQWLLNAALIANPIGLVVAAIALLVGGLILAYKKSDTFRGIVDGLWNNVLKPFGEFIGTVFIGYLKILANMWLTVGRFGIKAFTWLLKAAFKTFDGILAAAEKGLGWIPGIGDKISTAREAFDRFGNGVINKLEAVEGKLKGVQDRVNGLARDRQGSVTIVTRRLTAESTPGGTGFGPVPQLAAGGIVSARRGGILANIGEGRWDEAVVPLVNGRSFLVNGDGVTPLPGPAPMSIDDMPLEDLPAGAQARGPRQPLVFELNVDGSKLGEIVLDDFDVRAARR